MFYCDDCADKNKWPRELWMRQSRGPCEVCDKVRACYDVPSSSLPAPKAR
jgi:hypothetical protein